MCVRCQREMRCFKTGFSVQHDTRRWYGDGFECMSCDARVVINFGMDSQLDEVPIHPDDALISLDEQYPHNIPERPDDYGGGDTQE